MSDHTMTPVHDGGMSSDDLPVLDLYSERYTPSGNVAAAGIQNQLGRPKLDRLTVLIREALQNCWDARLAGGDGMRARVELEALDARAEGVLREHVLGQSPPSPAHSMGDLLDGVAREAFGDDEAAEGEQGLSEASWAGEGSTSGELRLLMFGDRGTSGLGGPTRADIVLEEDDGESRDFVDFLRNVGQPPDREFTGGTYGYGKAILYNTSAVRTILVYTRCHVSGRATSRFIAARLGDQFTVKPPHERSGRYTGRHWWGVAAGDGFAEPLSGEPADRLAAALGMDRDFEEGERGTTIAIVAPVLGERDPERALRYMGEQIIWNFWPLLRGSNRHGSERMRLSLTLNGEELTMPSVETFEPVRVMVNALENLEAHERGEPRPHPTGTVEEVWCQRPRKLLGHLSILRDMTRQPRWFAPHQDDRRSMPVRTRVLSHVALMRAPRIVVRYEEGEQLPSDMLHWGGVFVAHADVDHAYAGSEPPTHDDWAPEYLEDRHQATYVRVGLRRIQEYIRRFVAPERPGARGSEHVDLGAMSRSLGGLLVGQTGPGADIAPRRKKKRRARTPTTGVLIMDEGGDEKAKKGARAARIVVEDVELDLHEGVGVTVVTFRVEHAGGEEMTPVAARLNVVLENGRAESLDERDQALLEQPEVLLWRERESGRVLARRERRIDVSSNDVHEVLVSMVADARIKVGLVVEREEGSK